MTANVTMPMPNTPEEITLEWLRAIFKDEHISAFNITEKRLLETTGKIYITLSYDNEGGKSQDNKIARNKPKHILLKGGFNPDMFAVPGYKDILIRVYTREVNFFRRFAATLSAGSDLQVPKVYWADATPDQAIVAFEDLNAAGFTFGDTTRTYSVAVAKTGLEQLAALHAATWGWEATPKEHEWLNPPMYEVTLQGLFNMWDEMVLAEDRPPLPPIIRDSRERTQNALETYLGKRNPRFRCLLHGDPHSGNTYLDAQENMRFLDWQIVHAGSNFHDVTYFLAGALSVEDRRANELDLIDHYLAALARFGGPKMSLEDPEVLTEYKKGLITGMGWVLTPYAMQRKERVMAMVERYAAAIVDHKTIELLTGDAA